jgi:undecaprenyl diphosphate synthase
MTDTIKEQIKKGSIPKHIAMIMDGNGRWAKERGMDRIFGHHKGVDTVRLMVEACTELGVEFLTLYAFSTENWARPKQEVNALMELLVSTLKGELEKLHKNNVKIHTIGNTADLPIKCQDELHESIQQTANNTGLNLILALSYSAKWDISNSVKQIAHKVSKGELNPDDVNDEIVSKHLSTCNFPDVELLIRTSGEHRISNFLLWEMAYSELYFTNTHWPDFNNKGLYEAIFDFQKRERRFGKTSEQLNNEI